MKGRRGREGWAGGQPRPGLGVRTAGAGRMNAERGGWAHLWVVKRGWVGQGEAEARALRGQRSTMLRASVIILLH